MLNGLVPAKTLLSQVPFIEDVQSAFDELEQEKKANIAAQAAAFGAMAIPQGEGEEVD